MGYIHNSEHTFYFVLFVIALIIGGIYFASYYSHTETSTVIVQSTYMQQDISTDNNGHTSSEYHYRVYTNNGMYEVDQEGLFFSHPEVIANLHEGDTLTITSRGFNCPQLGIYRKIVNINNYEN